MNNCRDHEKDPLRSEHLVETYSLEDARTGYNYLTQSGQDMMNEALDKFLKSRGKFHTLKEIHHYELNRIFKK